MCTGGLLEATCDLDVLAIHLVHCSGAYTSLTIAPVSPYFCLFAALRTRLTQSLRSVSGCAGKSTHATLLAAALANAGLRVGIIDADPQLNQSVQVRCPVLIPGRWASGDRYKVKPALGWQGCCVLLGNAVVSICTWWLPASSWPCTACPAGVCHSKRSLQRCARTGQKAGH